MSKRSRPPSTPPDSALESPSSPSSSSLRKHADAECEACPLRANRRAVFAEKPKGEHKLTVIAEAPGQAEEQLGRPLIGASGSILIRELRKLRIERSNLHLTNALLCRPPKTMRPKEWKQALKCCRPRLLRELPNEGRILALGAKALVSTVGKSTIMPWRGYPLPLLPDANSNAQVYPTVHPAYVLREPAMLPVWREDLRRAVRGVSPWEWPPFVIEDGPEAEHLLERILNDADWVGVDVENRTGDPEVAALRCIGIAARFGGVSLPFDEPGERRTKHLDLIRSILGAPGIGKVYQNRSHDIQSLEANGFKLGGPVFDTMDAHAIAAPRLFHGLEFMATAHFPVPHWKTLFRVFDDRKDAFDSADPLDLRLYNCKDAWMTLLLKEPLTRALKRRHNGWELYEMTMKLGDLGLKMTRVAVAVNEEALGRHYLELSRKRDALKVRFHNEFGDHNMNSHKQMRTLFFEDFGVRPTFRTKLGLPSLNKNALEAIMAEEEGAPADAARLLYEYRVTEKLLSTYIEPLRREEP